MARTNTLGNFLTDVADAIRTKKGTSETIQASDFDTEIANLPSGGGDLDWSAIGYDSTPQSIIDSYNYAKYIQDNWVDNTSQLQDFKQVIICPLISLGTRTTMSYFAYGCNTLLSIPLFDTSNIISMSNAFYNCYGLREIPLFDTINLSAMDGIFNGCRMLTDNSLDNILQMCINATSYRNTKTLKAIGFVSNNYPVSRIEALPHYQDFIDAGWTIGY